MDKNKKKYLLFGGIAIVLIIALIVGIAMTKKAPEQPQEDMPIADAYQDPWYGDRDDPNENYTVPLTTYVCAMTNCDKITLNKVNEVSNLYVMNGTFKAYVGKYGTSFLSDLSLGYGDGKQVTIPNGEKMIIFSDLKEAGAQDNLAEYLYLADLAKDAGLYDVYFVATHADNFEAVLASGGYVLSAPTKEVLEFLDVLPDNFVMYVDEKNTIQGITGILAADTSSYIAASIFWDELPVQDIVKWINQYYKDTEQATKDYLEFLDKYELDPAPKEYATMEEINKNSGGKYLEYSQDIFKTDYDKNAKVVHTLNADWVAISRYTINGKSYELAQNMSMLDTTFRPDDYAYAGRFKYNDKIEFRGFGESKDTMYIITFVTPNGVNTTVKLPNSVNETVAKEIIEAILAQN